ncbi:MAG: tripartite tricarboxylate transporter substrate binding protein [Comamonadaceae bacterium]|nr:MAG: tripartite tricarboxylate transporter substrate binding protein [Comamonadaceae bacterium]
MHPVLSRRRLLQAGAFGAATVAAPAWAQSLAARPITLVVPYAPGGTGDILGRALANELATVTGSACVVENRGGAGGNVGAEQVVRARADGHTLLFTATSLASNPSLMKRMNFNPQKDLAAVAGPITLQNIVMVNNDLPVRTVRELVAHAKANPGKLSFGSSGIGTSNHLAVELFEAKAGVDMLHIPYKSAGEVIPSLLSGTTQVMFDLMPSALPHVKANKVRALAVTGTKRSALFPELPTVAESGVPDYEFSAWFGVFAPAATPPAMLAQLNAAINKAMGAPALSDRLAQLGAEAHIGTPDAFARYFKGEVDRWEQVIRSSGISLDS